jgi:hypothetical protein
VIHLVTQKLGRELISQIDEKLNSNTSVIFTQEEVAAIKQEMQKFTTEVLRFGEIAEQGTKKIHEYQQTILRLNAEITTNEAFIYSKGFRKEYLSFKDKKLKVFNQNRKFK